MCEYILHGPSEVEDKKKEGKEVLIILILGHFKISFLKVLLV